MVLEFIAMLLMNQFLEGQTWYWKFWIALLDAKDLLPTDPKSVFYLQVLDNCVENKNHTMFMYLTDLMWIGVFYKS